MSITANIYGYGSNLIHTYYNLWWNCMFLYSYWPLQVSLLLMDGMLDAFKPLNAFHCVALHVERDGVWLRLLLFFFSSPFLLSSLFLPLSLSPILSLSLSVCLSLSFSLVLMLFTLLPSGIYTLLQALFDSEHSLISLSLTFSLLAVHSCVW
jgi:hypothetical protein